MIYTRKFVSLSVILTCIITLVGCVKYISPKQGAVVREGESIGIGTLGTSQAVWETKDLKLSYTIAKAGELWSLKGVLRFSGSLLSSFGIIKSFNLKMSFVDSSGSVIQTVDITPSYSYLSAVDQELEVTADFSVPAGSSDIVFNYHGVFRADEATMGEWEIHHFPFDKN